MYLVLVEFFFCGIFFFFRGFDWLDRVAGRESRAVPSGFLGFPGLRSRPSASTADADPLPSFFYRVLFTGFSVVVSFASAPLVARSAAFERAFPGQVRAVGACRPRCFVSFFFISFFFFTFGPGLYRFFLLIFCHIWILFSVARHHLSLSLDWSFRGSLCFTAFTEFDWVFLWCVPGLTGFD